MFTCLIYMVDKDTVPLSSLFLSNQKYKLILHTQLSRSFHLPKSRCEIRMKRRNLFFFQGSSFTFSGRLSDIQVLVSAFFWLKPWELFQCTGPTEAEDGGFHFVETLYTDSYNNNNSNNRCHLVTTFYVWWTVPGTWYVLSSQQVGSFCSMFYTWRNRCRSGK